MSTVAELIKRIKKETSCYLLREGSNHEIWFNPKTGAEFTIPRHKSKEVKTGTANNILKQAGIK